MSSTVRRGTVRKMLATTALAGALALVPAAVAPQFAAAMPAGADSKVSSHRGDGHSSRGSDGHGHGRGYGQSRGYGQGRGYGSHNHGGLRNSSSKTESDNKPGYSSRCHGECGPD
ncbi:hypothetical protein [Nocardia cyriacigeorgica]|uniref:hypothetical protein n=1 Tax=Nocardia cyriacigeorgica TaxID=135487 RepID=UPI0024561248|nr:hypothetical protein [Nocardia cyriacigeorgica]BDU05279.1 hypothetical protein FMUBM48_15420 [Nocardia cyriacigeorgica]